MKNFAKTVSRFLLCERLSDWAKLGLRVFIGFMMLTHGIAKIEQFDTLKSTFPATMGSEYCCSFLRAGGLSRLSFHLFAWGGFQKPCGADECL